MTQSSAGYRWLWGGWNDAKVSGKRRVLGLPEGRKDRAEWRPPRGVSDNKSGCLPDTPTALHPPDQFSGSPKVERSRLQLPCSAASERRGTTSARHHQPHSARTSEAISRPAASSPFSHAAQSDSTFRAPLSEQAAQRQRAYTAGRTTDVPNRTTAAAISGNKPSDSFSEARPAAARRPAA